MNKFLKNIHYDNYDLNNIKYKIFICNDCSKKDSEKEFSEYKGNKLSKTLLNLSYLEVNYNDYPMIYITTPIMLCPFGININNNSCNLSLQFTNYKTDESMKNFFNFISSLEYKQMKYIGLDNDETDLYNSQIRYDKKGRYDPNLIVKVPFKNNKFMVDIRNEKYNNISIMNINKFTKMKCDIYMDKIWLFNDRYICKWKIKKIFIV